MDDTISLGRLTAADFTPQLDTEFALSIDDSPEHAVVLKAVRPFPGAAGHREGFALTFTGAPGVRLPQRMYRFTHPHMEAMDLFIVPIAANADSTTYEAIFA